MTFFDWFYYESINHYVNKMIINFILSHNLFTFVPHFSVNWLAVQALIVACCSSKRYCLCLFIIEVWVVIICIAFIIAIIIVGRCWVAFIKSIIILDFKSKVGHCKSYSSILDPLAIFVVSSDLSLRDDGVRAEELRWQSLSSSGPEGYWIIA